MQLEPEDIRYIRAKRRIYLVLFFLGIFARIAQVYTSYQEKQELEIALMRPIHNCLGFVLLNLILAIAFLSQFLPAAKRAGYGTWSDYAIALLLAVSLLSPGLTGCFGIFAFITIWAIDQGLYKTLKRASKDA